MYHTYHTHLIHMYVCSYYHIWYVLCMTPSLFRMHVHMYVHTYGM